MGIKVYVTLPDELAEALENWAAREGFPPGTIAGRLVAQGVEDAIVKGLAEPKDVTADAIRRLAAGEFVSDKELGLVANRAKLPLPALIKIRECLIPNGDHQHDHSPIHHR